VSLLRSVPMPGRPGRKADDPRELCVVLSCHHLVCAIPTRWIDRLVQPEEVATIAPAAAPADASAPRLVLVGERRFAAWNLGTLLGLAPLDTAWVLLRFPHRGDELAIALHTGACLVVQPLTPGIGLPAGVFSARAGAVASAVTTAAFKVRVEAEVALWLEPAKLWTGDELDAAAAALRPDRQAAP
jgi:hypothetical protein